MDMGSISLVVSCVALIVAIYAVVARNDQKSSCESSGATTSPYDNSRAFDLPNRYSSRSVRELVNCLDQESLRALESAGGLASSLQQQHVEIEHWLLRLFEQRGREFDSTLGKALILVDPLMVELNCAARSFPIGNGTGLDFSNAIVNLLGRAVDAATAEFGNDVVRPDYILYALLSDSEIAKHVAVKVPMISQLSPDRLKIAINGAHSQGQ